MRPSTVRRASRLTVLALGVALLLGVSLGAPLRATAQAAQDSAAARADADARQHFEAGRAYFQRARYDDAVREFDEAYRLSGRPALLLNLARAHELGGRPQPAVEAIELFLETAPADHPERAGLDDRLSRLRADAERRRVEEAEAAARAAAAGDDARPAAPPARGANGLFIAGIVTLSVAGATAIGTGITFGLTSSAYSDLEGACDSNGVCPADRADDIDSGKTMALVATILGAATIAVGLTGLLLLLLAPSDDDEAAPPTATRARIVPGPGIAGAGLEVSF